MSWLLSRRIALLGMALAGIVFGHCLTYVLAITDPIHRSEHFGHVGHSYWGVAVWVAATVAVACAVGVFVAGLRRENTTPPLVGSVLHTGSALAFLQVGGFLALETAERLLTGTPLADMMHHHLVVVGLVVQVALAFANAALLRSLIRAARLLVQQASLPTGGRAANAHPVPCWLHAPRTALLAGAWGVRGPPSSPLLFD